MNDNWYVYLLRCADDSLYAGITTNLARRLAEHNSSAKGAKYTRCRRPVSLAYSESAQTRSLASKREYQLRKLPRAEKLALVEQYQRSAQCKTDGQP